MPTLVIEHLKVSELPHQWAQRLNVGPEQTVTVRIETETEQLSDQGEPFVTDDPAFGIWRDRNDISDVADYVRKLRAARYNLNDVRREVKP